MREVILMKYGELILKGLNRHVFEDALFKRIKRTLYGCGAYQLTTQQSAICLAPAGEDFDVAAAAERLRRVFGIASISRACLCEKNMDCINRLAAEYLGDVLAGASTFKVNAKRSDKSFPLTSPQIMEETGAYLLGAFPNLSVDVHTPEVNVVVEIRDSAAFIHSDPIPGAGGMPAGTAGRAALLISGGIDSPVAGWMMAKRGVALTAVHFASPPYTSERARIKVYDLLERVSLYSGRIICWTVPFTHIQESIRDLCPEEYSTVIMRRFMMRAACAKAAEDGCAALITGESVGQVASQTMEALACTEAASSLPVYRPLIGMDKEEIVTVARKIDTYDISIEPYEDCCTIFTPRHPRTRPKLDYVTAAEEKLDAGALLAEALAGAEKKVIGY